MTSTVNKLPRPSPSLSPAGRPPSPPTPRPPSSRRHRLPQSRQPVGRDKTALVLAGGGITGVVYEIGALHALDQYFGKDFTIADFDMIVGLSAGGFVGSFLANGVTPEAMFTALRNDPHAPIAPFPKWDVFQPNFAEFFERALALPCTLAANTFKRLRSATVGGNPYVSVFDEILPSGLFTNDRVESYVRHSLHRLGRTNDFRQLRRTLYIVATELDTGDRIVFGDEAHDHVPISKAVQASTAIPLFYRPVRVGRRDYVDGAMRKTLHVDIAIAKGAKLIVCINPVVPLRNDIEREAVPLFEGKGRYLREKGFGYIAWQMLRVLLHSRIELGLERYQRLYPDVDIILIEPRMDDYRMFFHNIMDYEARVPLAKHGNDTVMAHLSEHFDEYAAIFARHGIELARPGRRIPLSVPAHRPAPPRAPALRSDLDISRLQASLDALEARLTDRTPPPPEAVGRLIATQSER
ncbi:MAG: patatin-like phospholipase family protein [Chloracidobacterium sp.]|uniref:Patatin-like phospholipase family protein n=1 Tax=Chloracidobacterium validum TaxID=2821543 RepID=A0ABX8B5N2_9BACT|nr:patatin-like phospholipase family protein [Chloracidobacterium validum]QUW02272.1 patatin-like phospholipase family protein [Chloracidobacterium validum]